MKSIIKGNREKSTKENVGYLKDHKMDSPLAGMNKKTEKSRSYWNRE